MENLNNLLKIINKPNGRGPSLKNKKEPVYKSYHKFDSQEEQEFYWWCDEAFEAGLIECFRFHPKPWILSEKITYPVIKKLKTKTKTVDKHLFHPHIYTPDFVIVSEGVDGLERYGHNVYVIDVKGGFSIYNNHREFSINQKWVWQKFGLYVNRVIPKKFFKKTWVPAKAILSPKQKKVRKCYVGFKTLSGEVIK